MAPSRASAGGRGPCGCGGRVLLADVAVNKLHDHRALADGGGASFCRAGANVTGGIDPGHARLEEVLAAGGAAGEDEAVLVALDRIVQPLRAGSRAEEEEQKREGQALSVLQRHRLEPAVVPVQLG